MDRTVFKEECVQRAYQYLRRKKRKQDLHKYTLDYNPEKPEGEEQECVDCLLSRLIYLK